MIKQQRNLECREGVGMNGSQSIEARKGTCQYKEKGARTKEKSANTAIDRIKKEEDN